MELPCDPLIVQQPKPCFLSRGNYCSKKHKRAGTAQIYHQRLCTMKYQIERLLIIYRPDDDKNLYASIPTVVLLLFSLPAIFFNARLYSLLLCPQPSVRHQSHCVLHDCLSRAVIGREQFQQHCATGNCS